LAQSGVPDRDPGTGRFDAAMHNNAALAQTFFTRASLGIGLLNWQ
jgi:hypothetical protein